VSDWIRVCLAERNFRYLLVGTSGGGGANLRRRSKYIIIWTTGVPKADGGISCARSNWLGERQVPWRMAPEGLLSRPAGTQPLSGCSTTPATRSRAQICFFATLRRNFHRKLHNLEINSRLHHFYLAEPILFCTKSNRTLTKACKN